MKRFAIDKRNFMIYFQAMIKYKSYPKVKKSNIVQLSLM